MRAHACWPQVGLSTGAPCACIAHLSKPSQTFCVLPAAYQALQVLLCVGLTEPLVAKAAKHQKQGALSDATQQLQRALRLTAGSQQSAPSRQGAEAKRR